MIDKKLLSIHGVIASLVIGACAVTHAQSIQENNIGIRVKRLLEATQGQGITPDLTHAHLAYSPKSHRYTINSGKRNFIVDDQSRVLVRIVLDGAATSASMAKQIAALNGTMLAGDQQVHSRVISAYLPVGQIAASASLPGVKAIHLESSPIHYAGEVTSQGVVALQADQAQNLGYAGKGVTVGILSNSFNSLRSQGFPITALSDVRTGDLPNTTKIPHEEGLKFALEDPYAADDEGRGMAQIVHDMAPAADLCFATADLGQAAFAEYLIDLRIDPRCGANIIVDDVFYYEEPFFSDGPIAQAVNLVTSSTTLPGKPVTYFTSAGNNLGGGAYAASFREVKPAAAAKLAGLPIDLSSIPSTVDVSGGFHNFNTSSSGAPVIAQQIQAVGSNPIVLQWDDLFDQGKVTADYNFLVFDSNGKYDVALSSAEDNFATDEPVEFLDLEAQSPSTFYLVIARTGKSSNAALHLKYINFANGGGELTGAYLNEPSDPIVPIIVGHAAARGAITVAAYNVSRAPFDPNPPYTPELERFTSPGPGAVAFDATGKRLSALDIRNKPNIACVDGVFTTFFGSQYLSSDAFPRFFGTSAAAPCAAGIGALMMEKASRPGGPGPLSAVSMRHYLEAAAAPRTLNPFELISTSSKGRFFQMVVSGNSDSVQSPAQFSLYFLGPKITLTTLALSLPAKTDAVFYLDSRSADIGTFYNPLVLGPSSPGVMLTSTTPSDVQALIFSSTFALNFSGFGSGDFFQFGLDRLDAQVGYFDDTADRLNGMTYVATFSDGSTATGALTVPPQHGYSPYDGYGLVNAFVAVHVIP